MIVMLQGGVGNQMFQYAFGRSVALARNEALLFEKRGDMDAPGSRMAYSLHAFKTSVNFVSGKPRIADNLRRACLCFRAAVYTQPYGSRFVGYWQTEKYFNADVVRKELGVRSPLSAQTARLAHAIDAEVCSVFIHVRRDDYLLPMNSWMGILPMSYYEKAMEVVKARCSDAKFFVFSDDPEWCRKNFKDCVIVDHNKAGTTGNGPGQEHEDLFLMSLCRHAIIANSSFSWWGAWLGDGQSDRIVVAPNQWFNGTLGGRWTPETSDIVPERWIKI